MRGSQHVSPATISRPSTTRRGPSATLGAVVSSRETLPGGRPRFSNAPSRRIVTGHTRTGFLTLSRRLVALSPSRSATEPASAPPGGST